jgi:ubiquinone/menaquinone biosynthesis C-methylase UbiE
VAERAPADLEQYRADSRDSWDRIASTWDAERDFLKSAMRPVGHKLIDRLDPQSGDTVLELAAGTGEMTPDLAKAVGENGRVLSTDFAPSMVESAQAQSSRLELANVEHRVLDAERMDLESSSVDRVVCRFGYMLMADPVAALTETRRVLRDAGRLAFAVWSTAERNPWAAIPGRTLVELGLAPPPEEGTPGPFVMGDPDRIRELVGAAGFGAPEIEEVRAHWDYADADDHWQRTLTLSPSMSGRISELPEADRERVRKTVGERVDARLAEGADAMDGIALVVSCD